MIKNSFIVSCLFLASLLSLQAQLRIPAFTAYLEPNPDGARVSERRNITGWNGLANKVLWFGEFKTNGNVHCVVEMRLAEGAESALRLSMGGQSHEAHVRGAGSNLVAADFGSLDVTTGYQRFTLESLNTDGHSNGDIEALILDGPAIADAHFNLKPRRNAASVHLNYPVPREAKIAAFYCEVTPLEDPLWTYYMACGWHRGYFGMQVNSPTERRLIFSVWDSGGEGKDRDKVGAENRVTLVAKGDGVVTGDFGNEGTGGHSHLIYPWKTGETQRFLVTAKPDGTNYTIFSGFHFDNASKKWRLISSWRAPHEGGWMHGLYSFNEDFVGSNGELRRKALFGNQWIQLADEQWNELTTASFSHDGTGKTDRLDRFMGVEQSQFFLSNGGFIPGFTKFGEKFVRPATGHAPDDFDLLALPK